MPIQVAVLKENRPDEKRVAMVPAVADKLSKLGCELSLLSGAGLNSKLPDSAYTAVRFVNTEPELLATANIVLAVQHPTTEQINLMPPGCILLSFVYPHKEPDLTRLLRDKHITCFAMEQVPRISRAQAMDALSSQAALAGYYAALLGATKLARILPMMTTAVGSIRPARCLVMGLGVAGLQALADFLEANVPEAERPRAGEMFVRILNGSLLELDTVAREQAGVKPLPLDSVQGFMAQAVLASDDEIRNNPERIRRRYFTGPMHQALIDINRQRLE